MTSKFTGFKRNRRLEYKDITMTRVSILLNTIRWGATIKKAMGSCSTQEFAKKHLEDLMRRPYAEVDKALV